MSPQHVVVVGAARSGTKIFRDALAEATAVGKVPYDIGYVWRVGNEGLPDDVVPPQLVSETSRRFIRRFVDRYADGQPAAVIEKTVGNTLRVPTVHAVLPDAKYVHLLRDGVDVIESTRRQWMSPTDTRYLLGKVRHFPPRLVPRYGVKYLRSLARRRIKDDGRMGSWGPRYPGIDQDLDSADLLTVCCRQWREATRTASADLRQLGVPVVEVRYEDLVRQPNSELTRVADFLRLQLHPELLAAACRRIVPDRNGVGREALTPVERATVDAEVGDLLAELGYEPISPHQRDDDRT
jgi:Sulfotransferase family